MIGIFRFVGFQSEINVAENVPLNYALTEIRAVDADFDADFTRIQYQIASGGQGKVAINSTTVSTTNTLHKVVGISL